MSTLGTVMTDLQAAQIAVEAARVELARLKTLREQNNASEKALLTAEAAVAHEETNLQAILVKVQAAWGKKLADLVATYATPGSRTNKPDPLPNQLFALEQVFVRVDFPPGEGRVAPEGGVRLFSLNENSAPIQGQFFDFAPTTDPQTQSRGLFYIVDNSDRQLAAGMALKASAATADKPRAGVIVPREAILRSEGKTWVYVQIEPDKFTRREVALEQITDKGWFVDHGLNPQDKVVVAGAQELLSEELKEQ